MVNLSTGNEAKDVWSKMVSDNIRISSSLHRTGRSGEHVLKFWLVDPGPVLQKIVVAAGGVKPSYLGPPESYQNTDKSRITQAN